MRGKFGTKPRGAVQELGTLAVQNHPGLNAELELSW